MLEAVLALRGSGPETKRDIPQLIKQANVKLGLDAAGVRGDDPGAAHRRKLLGSLSTVVNTTGELRNAGLGTGHGLSVGPTLDVASARLVAAAILRSPRSISRRTPFTMKQLRSEELRLGSQVRRAFRAATHTWAEKRRCGSTRWS